MPTYEVTIGGEQFEIEAPDDASVKLAVKQLQSQQNPAKKQLDDYYSSGIYAGEYNPLGPIARSLDAGATSAGDVLSFGFGDEIAGLWGATDDQRNRQKALAESNPYATVAGAVGGGLVMGGGRSPFSAGGNNIFGQAQGSRSLLSALPSANQSATASLGSRIVASGLEGGAMGAAYGAGSGENAWDRFSGAVGSGLVGGAIGGAVPAVIQGLSSGYRNVADYFARNQVARDAGVSPEVANYLVRIGNNDGTLGPQGAANMARAGGEAMPVDAGVNSQQALDWATQRGGPGANTARQRINDRLTRDSAALVSTLDNTLGTPEGLYASQANIREGARDGVRQAYSAANASPIDYASAEGQRVESAINRIPSRIKAAAIEKANERMAWDKMPNMQIMADVADDGTVTLREMPNVMQADYIKKALDDLVREGTDMGGKMSGDAQFANIMRRELRDALAGASDEYATALRTAADPLSRQEAVGVGYDLLTDRLKRDELAMTLDGFTDGQRNAARQGVRSYIDDTMAKVRTAFTDPNLDAREAAKAIKELSSRANREKLTMLLGVQEAGALFDEIDRVSQSFSLNASQAQNSKTFTRTAAEDVANELVAPNPIERLMDLEPVKSSQGVAQILTGRTPERLAARKDAFAGEIADYLTRPASQAIPQFQAMGNYGQRLSENQIRSLRIAELLSGIRSGAYPASTQVGGFGE